MSESSVTQNAQERALHLKVTVLNNMDLKQLVQVARHLGLPYRVYSRHTRTELIRRILVRQEEARREGDPPAPDAYATLNSVAALSVAIRVLRRSRDQQAGTALRTLLDLRMALQDG